MTVNTDHSEYSHQIPNAKVGPQVTKRPPFKTVLLVARSLDNYRR